MYLKITKPPEVYKYIGLPTEAVSTRISQYLDIMQGKITFNRFYIIESLKPEEDKTGKDLFDNVFQPLLNENRFLAATYISLDSREQFHKAKVFIQAGSGGVGTFAIQFAKHLGATVATTTSAGNIDLVKSLGADIVIDYRKEDFETVLKDYDIVLNSQDAKTLEKSLRVLKPGGKLISIAGPPDPSFAEEIKAPWFMKFIVHLLSAGVSPPKNHHSSIAVTLLQIYCLV
ncbi:zinc-binding dehydrogenase [Chitinophaga sp. RAB17]|uniref:zinc-binding dehydrogenase n=1 Tax=Chitinophaga sp. RAB17 TaxID=3233049 RepID=UPI003F93B2D9